MHPSLIIALPLLLVLPLAAIGHFAAMAQAQAPVCGDSVMQDRIRGLMYDAVDEAFKEHIGSLFLVWMKDATGQPKRAAGGVNQSINAYVHASTVIENWNLKPCK